MSTTAEGEEYVIGLEPEDREVYEHRVGTCIALGLTLEDAREVARSHASLDYVTKLVRKRNVPPEVVKHVVY